MKIQTHAESGPGSMSGDSIRQRVSLLAVLALWLLLNPVARAEEASYPAEGYLEVTEGVDLALYRGAVVAFEPTRVEANVDRPKALERVQKKCDKQFWHRFDKRFQLFDGLTDAATAAVAGDQPALSVAIQLKVDAGSGKKRWGMGTLLAKLDDAYADAPDEDESLLQQHMARLRRKQAEAW